MSSSALPFYGPLTAAWAGGIDGRQVIDRFLPSLPLLLSRPSGTAYIVLVEENKPKELAMILRDRWSLKMTLIATRRAQNELLHIAKIVWL